jgi:hypothetical protein
MVLSIINQNMEEMKSMNIKNWMLWRYVSEVS